MYKLTPNKNEKTLAMYIIIFLVAYVAMAIYDYLYHCDKPLLSGMILGPNTLDAIFKPQRTDIQNDANKKNFLFNAIAEFNKRVYLFHILVVAPLLIYIGWNGLPPNTAVLSLGIIALMYHSVRLFKPRLVITDTSADRVIIDR